MSTAAGHKRPYTEGLERNEDAWRNNLFKDTTCTLRDLLKLRLGAGAIFDKLGIKIRRAYLKIYKTLDKENNTTVTSDDLSWKMYEFIDEIAEIAAFDNRESLSLALYLLNELREYSWDRGAPGLGHRAPDKKADKLMAFVIRRSCKAGLRENWGRELEELEYETEERALYGVEPWYPETKETLNKIVKRKEDVEKQGTVASEGESSLNIDC
ncbi:hypothetical protein QBC40DRAFT_330918 [Triangularia verruculosa]|uniref:Uncharacterized protein n=1 Tax=Triangularia verruculosa TaxID=2587418 RepID=A0AAN7AYS4_9PEZI|nr:hypothetical protein QBC40DRAFT_330918 [Triangularia verruculosa]